MYTCARVCSAQRLARHLGYHVVHSSSAVQAQQVKRQSRDNAHHPYILSACILPELLGIYARVFMYMTKQNLKLINCSSEGSVYSIMAWHGFNEPFVCPQTTQNSTAKQD